MLKCTKFDIGWGSSQRSPRISSWILGGPTFKEREGREKERTGKGKGRVKAGSKRSRGEGRRGSPIKISGYATGHKSTNMFR